VSLLGFDAVGLYALGQVDTGVIPALASFSSAGTGAMAVAGISKGNMALGAAGLAALAAGTGTKSFASMSGAGVATFTGVLLGQASATSQMAGGSTLGAADHLTSAAALNGVGTLSAVGYSFVLGAEKAGPPQELRAAVIEYENRTAVVDAEDRVYYSHADNDDCGPPNRKRSL
jgi:hypothetical protein